VLGWPGHEIQWRGGDQLLGTRQEDIRKIFESASWMETNALLKKYKIRYIYIGALERTTYKVYSQKFNQNLHPVYEHGNVVIYELPQDETEK
jgi:uncharacterized membrane protein